MKRIYFDNNAGTLLDPRVAAAMTRALESNIANPSALHAFGREARRHVEDARATVATILKARPEEVIFTSGATEANNLAVAGLARAAGSRRRVLVSPVEHPSILEPCRLLESDGFDLEWMPVDADGVIDTTGAAALLGPDVAFSTMMWINNETGAVQPVREWADRSAEAGVPFHCDAAQAAGRVPVDLAAERVTTLSTSAHKFHGPQGVGALFIRRGTTFEPTLVGGGQEREKRAGTENVAGIVGFARALEIAAEEMADRVDVLRELNKAMVDGLTDAGIQFAINAENAERWPGALNLRFQSILAESLLMNLDLRGIAVSVGSACSSGSLEPSTVLEAMGLDVAENLASIRVSMSHLNTLEDVRRFVSVMSEITETTTP